MTKNTLQFVWFFLISTNSVFSQNLVVNSGLENFITCPGFGQFDSTYVNDWWKPTYASTDYYHTNCSGIQPINQIPHGGDAYFGIIAYNFGTEYREYATGKLSTPLVAGIQYTVQFYVSLNDGYIQAINEIGAYLSPGIPGPYTNSLHIPVTPQIQNSGGILSSITSWMLVSETFIAAGGERYITIGNFNDDPTTTITQVGNTGSFGAYYFVDDVSVSAEPNGIPTLASGQNLIYPNPSNDKFNINFARQSEEKFIYDILDYSGKQIKSGIFIIDENSLSKSFDLSKNNKGIYFLKLYSKNKMMVYKLVKL